MQKNTHANLFLSEGFYDEFYRKTKKTNLISYHYFETMKVAFAFAAIVSGAAAFSAKPAFRATTALNNGPVKGAGGMHDTRDPAPFVHEDPRKSISAAPSFEEYLKQRQAEGN